MQKQGEESNILVAVRIRPLNPREVQGGEWDVVRGQDNMIIVLDPVDKELEHENRAMLQVYHRSKEQKYAFDRVFREQSGSEIYSETVKPLIQSVLQGRNATVFAYGPTGSGKTHTMLGNQDTHGLNVLAIADVFELIEENPEHDYVVVISYVEIYNEMIRDLLVPSSGYLDLRDDAERGLVIAGVAECRAESTDQVLQLLLAGNRRRTTEATNANLTSSRSHAVFQVMVSRRPRTKAISVETLTGKLSLIDLAGSERGTVTENRGIRLMEGSKINRSLLALANVINALGDKNKKGFFVPYRDSKLTRLLKDSLGGNCRTVMITNISPASGSFEETINTLKYANRAKNIKTKQITNKQLVSIHITEYKNIINDLRAEIEQLKEKIVGGSEEGPLLPIHSGHPVPTHSGHPPSNSKKEGHICHCGRMEEGQEIRRIKVQVFENFNERIQLRRALMEIDEQNALNILEIRRKKAELVRFESGSLAGRAAEEVATLKLNTRRNLLRREITDLQLQESIVQTRRIRDEMNLRIRTKDNRDFLDIIIKNHILELQNIELEISLEAQERSIATMESFARQQRARIIENGLQVEEAPEGGQNEDEIELDIDDEDEGEANADAYEDNDDNYGEKSPRNKESVKTIRIEPEDNKNQWNSNGQGTALVRGGRSPQESEGKGKHGLDFNLKGVNFKLSQKMPLIPRKKK